MTDRSKPSAFDPDAPPEMRYYILGVHPVRVTVVDDLPICAEKPDESGAFVQDNTLIRRLNDAMDVVELDEHKFREYCLSRGLKYG